MLLRRTYARISLGKVRYSDDYYGTRFRSVKVKSALIWVFSKRYVTNGEICIRDLLVAIDDQLSLNSSQAFLSALALTSLLAKTNHKYLSLIQKRFRPKSMVFDASR